VGSPISLVNQCWTMGWKAGKAMARADPAAGNSDYSRPPRLPSVDSTR
jgi:hypothetical protein